MTKNKTDLSKLTESNDVVKPSYHFGGIEILKFEDLNLPQFELSVFASADIADGGRGGSGANDIRVPATWAPAPFF